MRPTPVYPILFCLFAAAAQAGQMYRWVDERGRVNYSDRPPPTAQQINIVNPRGNVVQIDKEGYALRRARETNPIGLFVTDCGPPCDQARDFLAQRGIPYTRKDPQKVPEDAVELKKLIGLLEVPVIRVGSSHYKGFEAEAWTRLLEAAGYPLDTASSSN